MYFGVDYYPEHWPREEWEHNAELMVKGNFNVVRLAEFAWKKLEPREGEYDFTWLDDAIDVLTKKNIKIILGTPTATPPKWLVNKYDVYMHDSYGRQRGFGSRRDYCYNNPFYRMMSERIVNALSKHYKDNENIVAWQIDNEFGCHGTTRCYCEHCRMKFGSWLEKKYGDIDTLNKEWGTVFWSLDYDSFNDIILPAYSACEGENGHSFVHNPSMELDYRRFASDSVAEYQNLQIGIIKRYSNKEITHNMMGHFSDIDYYKLGKELDFVSWDNYPQDQWSAKTPANTSMAHKIMYGVKNKGFWVMEEQSGACGWDVLSETPRPNQLRLWTYQAIANGAEGIVYFRWRAATVGMEQYWYGVLDHDGVPRRRFYELAETGAELKRIQNTIIGADNLADVLLVKSYDNVWSHEIKRHNTQFNYNDLLYSYFSAMWKNNIQCDVSSVDVDFSKYKVVFMVAFNVVNDDIMNKVDNYVQNGGNVVFTFRSGTRNWNNNMTTRTLPGYFKDMSGIEVYEFDSLSNGHKVLLNSEVLKSEAHMWCDVIEPVSAEVIARYGSEFYKDKAAITVNKHGEGRVFYVGCHMDDSGLMDLVSYICENVGVEKTYNEKIDYVEIIKKEKDGQEFYMILNYNESCVEVPFDGEYISLISGQPYESKICEYGVEIIKKKV